MQPVDHAFGFLLVALGGFLAQIGGAFFGGFQVAVLAGEQVGRGEAVDRARDGVDLLQAVVGLAAVQGQVGAVIRVIDRLAFELAADVEIRELADLLDPPVLVLEAPFRLAGGLAGEGASPRRCCRRARDR